MLKPKSQSKFTLPAVVMAIMALVGGVVYGLMHLPLIGGIMNSTQTNACNPRNGPSDPCPGCGMG